MGLNNLYADANLQHYGVKGMHWGIRRDRSSGPNPVSTATNHRGQVVAKGGDNHAPSEDAVKAAVYRQKAKKNSTDALSTQELQALVQRMNLEQQYHQLASKDPRNKSQAQETVKKILATGKTINEINNFLNSPVGKPIKTVVVGAVKSKLKPTLR